MTWLQIVVLAIVQGLSGKMCKGGHSSWFGAMGCYRAGGEHDEGSSQSHSVEIVYSPNRMYSWG